MLKVVLTQKLKAVDKQIERQTLQGLTLGIDDEETSQNLGNFRDVLDETLESFNEETQDLDDFIDLIYQVAIDTLSKKDRPAKRKDIDRELDNLLKDRQWYLDHGWIEQVKEVTARIKKHVRASRIKEQVNNMKNKHWDPIKFLKKGTDLNM